MREGKKVDAILRLTFDNFLFFKSFFNKKPRDLKLIVSKRSRAQVNNSSLPEKSQKKNISRQRQRTNTKSEKKHNRRLINL